MQENVFQYVRWRTCEEGDLLTGVWRAYARIPLIGKIMIGFIGGIVVGLLVGPAVAVIKPLGDLFIRLLSMLVMPLIFFTILSGAASISPKNLGRVGGKIFIYYMITSAFAIAVGLGIGMLIHPGAGLHLAAATFAAPKSPPLADVILNIVPKNPFASLSQGDPLAVIFFALLLGIALSQLKESGRERAADLAVKVLDLAEGINEALFVIVEMVLQYAPIGVLSLIAVVVGTQGLAVLLPLAKLTAAVYGGGLFQLGVYTVLLRLFGVPVVRFFRAAKDTMATAFVTRSSNGTLPVTMESAARLGIPRSIYGFSLPLGATINMDGTAVYMGAAVIFAANMVGVHLTWSQLFSVILVGTLASVGTAGVPSSGLIMVSMVLAQAGLPLATVGMIAGIDAILDMMRTMVNVTGDLAGTAIVANTEGQLGVGEPAEHAAGATG
jgi:Na+/H+-dicarboxylate symporter